MQQKKEQKLSRSIQRVCLIFSICLSLGATLLGFYTYTNGMIGKYKVYLRSILNYVASEVVGNDLENCIDTMTKSDHYMVIQALMNDVKENFDIEYIYMLTPLSPSGTDNMMYVMTGVRKQELLEFPDEITLGDRSGNDFSESVTAHYIREMEPDADISYFANITSFGFMYTGMIPIKNRSGQPVTVLSVDIRISEMVETIAYYAVICLIGSVALSALFRRMLFKWMRERVIDPVQRMETAASTFVANSHSDAGPESLVFNDPDIHTGDEIQALSDALSKMSDDVRTYLTNLLTQTREKERIASELNVATQIQADMLPSIFPPFPGNTEFDIYAAMNPAKEVGGDFYDFFLVDDDHLAMVMADVSGKGVPAALFMVIAKTLLKNRAQQGGTPSEILKDVNNQLCEGNKSQLFVTVWFAILDISTGKGLAANAGHEHPVICRAGGEWELEKYRHSMVMGTMEGIPFRQHEFELHPGDRIFVYTDGVPEATNAANELYGTDRMLAALNRAKESSLEDTLRTVHEDVERFVGDAPQFDDLTMLCMRYDGRKEA